MHPLSLLSRALSSSLSGLLLGRAGRLCLGGILCSSSSTSSSDYSLLPSFSPTHTHTHTPAFLSLPVVSAVSRVACPRRLRQQVKCTQSPSLTTSNDSDRARSWSPGKNISRIWLLFQTLRAAARVEGGGAKLASKKHLKRVGSDPHCQNGIGENFKWRYDYAWRRRTTHPPVCYSRVNYSGVCPADKLKLRERGAKVTFRIRHLCGGGACGWLCLLEVSMGGGR